MGADYAAVFDGLPWRLFLAQVYQVRIPSTTGNVITTFGSIAISMRKARKNRAKGLRMFLPLALVPGLVILIFQFRYIPRPHLIGVVGLQLPVSWWPGARPGRAVHLTGRARPAAGSTAGSASLPTKDPPRCPQEREALEAGAATGSPTGTPTPGRSHGPRSPKRSSNH